MKETMHTIKEYTITYQIIKRFMQDIAYSKGVDQTEEKKPYCLDFEP